jgi:hypothetical protein
MLPAKRKLKEPCGGGDEAKRAKLVRCFARARGAARRGAHLL